MPLISAASLNSRFVQLAIAALFLVGTLYWFMPSVHQVASHLPDKLADKVHDIGNNFEDNEVNRVTNGWHPRPKTSSPATPKSTASPKTNHPVDTLIERADQDYKKLLDKETQTLSGAAAAYRKRRGRQPPPRFDQWFAYAQNQSAVIVEDFFDQIHHDIAPLWGLPAKSIREHANVFIHRISVRRGIVTSRTDIEEREWLKLWRDMVQSVAEHLPDMDLAINEMDESRMVVPWEEINEYMTKERAGRRPVPVEELREAFTSEIDLRAWDKVPPEDIDFGFTGNGPYWTLAVVGCPPESAARKAYIETDFSTPPPLDGKFPEGSYEGYVSNFTLARSPCDNPALQGLHGTFVEPISISTTKKFFPMFGGSKLPMNNEILLPPAMYWTDDPFYSGGSEHGTGWSKKKNGLVWRGAASGGRNKEENWKRFQRHRFVAMANSSLLRAAALDDAAPPNFAIPADNPYDLAISPTDHSGRFADWLHSFADAAVVHLLCFPDLNPPHCQYTAPYFTVAKPMPMKEQYSYKYLPDIDGNSFSGRYRAFLYSTSLPIKATIYQEWHDSRLVPWKHFVPMDNTFADFYGIMEYFVGNEEMGVAGHDDVAAKIAENGRMWAEKVLRKEDMSVYVLRLLLEYARVSDDAREVLGWKEGADVPKEGDETQEEAMERYFKEAADSVTATAEMSG